jgi:hypothetical protein
MSEKLKSIGIGYAHPHAEAAKNIAGQVDHTNVKVDLGRPPLPKRAFTTAPPEIHSGMNAKSKSGVHFAGLSGQDLSRYDANPGNDPLAGAPRGKRLTPVQRSPGMRSRVSDALASAEPGAAHDRAMLNKNALTKGLQDTSKAVLDEAGNASDFATRWALGIGKCKLPDTTEED